MKRLVIAIDCDDVLLNTTEFTVDAYNRLYGTEVETATAHTSNNPLWQADRETAYQRFDHIQSSEDYANLEPLPETIKVIHALAKQHELHIVTARPQQAATVTNQMVERFFADCFLSIEHVGPDASKGEVCERIEADVMIDDNVRHLEDTREHGVANLIWFGNYPWQSVQDASRVDVVRCTDWLEAKREVDRIAAE